MWGLYSRLPREDYIIAAHETIDCVAFDKSHNLSVVRMPLELESWGAIGWRRGAAYYQGYSRLRQIVRNHRVQSVHAGNCLPEGFWAWMLRRGIGLPYCVYVHGEELNCAKKS